MTDWVIDYLTSLLRGTISHKERHFAYVALGEIGGQRVRSLIEQGLDDPNPFARSGAEMALQQLEK
jgi:hypothetical protein